MCYLLFRRCNFREKYIGCTVCRRCSHLHELQAGLLLDFVYRISHRRHFIRRQPIFYSNNQHIYSTVTKQYVTFRCVDHVRYGRFCTPSLRIHRLRKQRVAGTLRFAAQFLHKNGGICCSRLQHALLHTCNQLQHALHTHTVTATCTSHMQSTATCTAYMHSQYAFVIASSKLLHAAHSLLHHSQCAHAAVLCMHLVK